MESHALTMPNFGEIYHPLASNLTRLITPQIKLQHVQNKVAIILLSLSDTQCHTYLSTIAQPHLYACLDCKNSNETN